MTFTYRRRLAELDITISALFPEEGSDQTESN